MLAVENWLAYSLITVCGVDQSGLPHHLVYGLVVDVAIGGRVYGL